MLVTVRLFPQIHGTLIEELAKASRGLRAARAICLMTVGLTHERGNAHGAMRGVVALTPQVTDCPQALPVTSEDAAFVSALLEEHGG